MTVELISRLNAKVQDTRMLPPGFEQLTPPDVSHAISLFRTKGARLLGRVMYADQPSFAKELQHELLLELKAKAREWKWHNIGPLAKLSAIAVNVYCAAERCRKCNGIGEKKWGARITRCPACTRQIAKGVEVSHGYQRVYHSDIARELGVSTVNMSKTWRPRYGVALSILAKWDEQCWDGFRLALSRKTVDNR